MPVIWLNKKPLNFGKDVKYTEVILLIKIYDKKPLKGDS